VRCWNYRARVKGTTPIRSQVLDEERMRPDYRSELVLCVPFSALTLMVGWKEGHPVHKNPISLIPSSSLLEHRGEASMGGDGCQRRLVIGVAICRWFSCDSRKQRRTD